MSETRHYYPNRSMFFIPIRFQDFAAVTKLFESAGNWNRIDYQNSELETNTPYEKKPNYLLPYITRIIDNRELFQVFECVDFQDDCLFYPTKEAIPACNYFIPSARVSKVLFSCFSTNVGFLEYWVDFDSNVNSLDMLQFSYYFKRGIPSDKWDTSGKKGLLEYSQSIVPDGSDFEFFFTSKSDLKKECRCFHTYMIKPDETNDEGNALYQRFARTYSRTFPTAKETSDNDMLYKPYDNIVWTGSPESIANIVSKNTGDDDYYIEQYLSQQIETDYRFMYLILLNQRFSLLNYIEKIAQNDKSKLEQVYHDCIRLKTTFSFRVVSDDLIFQSIYSKMYAIMDIDKLVEDTVDSEKQASALINEKAAKSANRRVKWLTALSILSVASFLIDSSSYLQQAFPILSNGIVSIISMVILIIIAILIVFFIK